MADDHAVHEAGDPERCPDEPERGQAQGSAPGLALLFLRSGWLAHLLELSKPEPGQRQRDQNGDTGEDLNCAAPAQHLGQEIGRRKRDRSGKACDERDNGDALFRTASQFDGDDGETRLVEAGGVDDANGDPDRPELPKFADHGQEHQKHSSRQNGGEEHRFGVAPVDDAPGAWRGEPGDHQRGGERTGDVSAAPPQIALPDRQKRGECIIERRPDQCFGHGQWQDRQKQLPIHAQTSGLWRRIMTFPLRACQATAPEA